LPITRIFVSRYTNWPCTRILVLADKMKKVMQDIPAGKDKIRDLAHSLKEKFPRRPAMQEELNKLLK